jgi:hypothetical protein
MDHVRQLNESTVFIFIGMITGLRTIPRSTRYEDSPIFSLYRAESDRDVEVYVQEFPCFLVCLDIIKRQYPLIKLEEVYSISRAFITISSVCKLGGISESHTIPCSISHEGILSIASSEGHTLSEHSLIIVVSIVLIHHGEAMLAELWVDNRRVLSTVASTISFFSLLLEENPLKLNI